MQIYFVTIALYSISLLLFFSYVLPLTLSPHTLFTVKKEKNISNFHHEELEEKEIQHQAPSNHYHPTTTTSTQHYPTVTGSSPQPISIFNNPNTNQTKINLKSTQTPPEDPFQTQLKINPNQDQLKIKPIQK